jgi:peptidoglycan/LPS O-acetylase OafA/YrhL
MKKFIAIEGLRGWLAWAVMISHVVQTSDLYAKGLGPMLMNAGHSAVLVFIIISGFVITHLVTERPEPYGPYLLRRFMRIFPLFAVTCIIGFFTNDLHALALSRVAWAADPGFSDNIAALYAGIAHSNHAFFPAHVLAHLTMLHGMISNALLPLSQYAFNSPAWSLSLEWQFYLLAPFAIMLAHWRRAMIWAAVAIAVLETAYQFGLLGEFRLPSFLPGAAGYFVVGIASRLAYPTIAGTVRHPNIILALLIVLIPLLGRDAIPILVWALVLAGLILNSSDADTASFARVYQRCLGSRAATYFGSRSYSVYLCHLSVIAICHSLWLGIFPVAGRALTFLGVSAMAVPLTIIAAELLYRGIEQPGIALGSWLARRNEVVVAGA